MNNYLDTVFASTPLKFNIKDSNGNTIYSNCQIELATSIQTQGTALNKAFFDSIKTDLTNLEPIFGTYAGTGNRTVTAFNNLGFIPKFAIIGGYAWDYSSTQRGSTAFFMSNGTEGHISIFYPNTSSSTAMQMKWKNTSGDGDGVNLIISSNGFSFTAGSSSATTGDPLINESGHTYYYILFK